MSAALGVANFVGVIWLSSLMTDPQVLYRNAELVQSVGGFLPALQVYAALFFAIPFLRNFRIGMKNKQIDRRNTFTFAIPVAPGAPGRKAAQETDGSEIKGGQKIRVGEGFHILIVGERPKRRLDIRVGRF